MSNVPDSKTDVLDEIVADRPNGGRRIRLIVIGAAIVVAVAAFLLRPGARPAAQQYKTEEATRGDLIVTVSATGTLQPTNEIDVGSEVSGLVESVFVDDNDRVTKGQVLARLDVSKLRDAVVTANAALASAEAGVLQAAATVQEAKASLARMRQAFELSSGKVPSKAEMDTAEATAARAAANELSTRAGVNQARAALSSAETNLSKASIVSPINGVVLKREIEPGQTVAASFEAPVLFKLAEDLSKMELQVDVDEADVGQVRDGQKAQFTVDAYPGRKFPASIGRVNYGSQTKDNVVSYKTLLTVDNTDLSLRPGMTATAEITTLSRIGVLLVPNAALRFTPPEPTQAAPKGGGIVSSLIPRPPDQPAKKASGNGANGEKRVWVLANGTSRPVSVTVGSSDGHRTEITGGDLQARMQVITEVAGGKP